MGVKKLNEYRIDFTDNRSETFMAEDTRVVADIKETDNAIIAQICCVKRNIGVATPIRNVKFSVMVTPESAEESNCRVAPDAWVVPEGTKVIFTAMPSEGFNFVGWFKDGAALPLSTDTVAELVVEYPTDPTALAAEFEAKFAPIEP